MDLILHPQTEQSVNMFLSNPSHAVSVIGSSGAGKDHLSYHLASRMLGISMKRAKTSSQIYIVDAEAGQGIDEIRELKLFLSLIAPGSANIRRCVLIRHPEKFQHAAQNSLLKILEEPPLDTVIICTISDSRNILPTITSRLQSIRVLPISYTQAKDTFPQSQIDRAYHISEGNIGLLQAILENDNDHPLVILIAQAKSILGVSGYERLARLDVLVKDKTNDIPSLLQAMYKVLHAALISSVNQDGTKIDGTAKLNNQIKKVLRAQNLVEGNTQPKIVLSWLFYSL